MSYDIYMTSQLYAQNREILRAAGYHWKGFNQNPPVAADEYIFINIRNKQIALGTYHAIEHEKRVYDLGRVLNV